MAIPDDKVFNRLIDMWSALGAGSGLGMQFVRALVTDCMATYSSEPLSGPEQEKAGVIVEILSQHDIGGSVSMRERVDFMSDNIIARMSEGQKEALMESRADPANYENGYAYLAPFRETLDSYGKAVDFDKLEEEQRFQRVLGMSGNERQIHVLAQKFHLAP